MRTALASLLSGIFSVAPPGRAPGVARCGPPKHARCARSACSRSLWGAARTSVAGLVTLVTLVALAACGDAAPSGAPTAAPLAPLPPPPDLALECVLPTPDASWEKTRALLGGPAAFLPRSAGGLVATTLHFPMALSEAIDGRVPAFCAGTLSAEGAARIVLGVHLRWPDRLLDGLTKGQDARFTSALDAATQIAVLQAKDPKDAVMPSGVLGSYLLIGVRAEDLLSLGPYIARTLPSRSADLPAGGVRIAGADAPAPADLTARLAGPALRGPLAAAVSSAWSTVRDRAADALPAALPVDRTVTSLLALIPHMEGAELSLVAGDRTLRAEVTATAQKGSPAEAAVRGLSTGDSAPLLAMPKDALAGILVRRAPRAAGQPDDPSAALPLSDLAKTLGVKDPKDATALETAARALEGAAGDWLAAGFAFDGTGPSGFVRAAVRDGEAMDSALKQLVAVAERAAPKDPVKGKELQMKTGKTVLENIPGDVFRLRIGRGRAEAPPASGDTPTSVDVLFRRRDDVFFAATGYASRDALRALLEASQGESLTKVAEVEGPLARLGSATIFAAFADPGRIAASRAGRPGSVTPSPIVVGLSRSNDSALRLTIDATGPALAEALRRLAP